MAGARELANLAHQWYSDGANPHAQRCIDALCAYLRVRRYTRYPRSEQTDSAVREQITCLVTDFLRSGLGAVQGGILVNLAGVRIRGRHVFDGVTFGPGLRLILDGAQLEEDSRLSFHGCHFRGCIVRLHRVSLQRRAVLSLVGSTLDAGAWLFASTATVHPTARVDVRGVTAGQPVPAVDRVYAEAQSRHHYVGQPGQVAPKSIRRPEHTDAMAISWPGPRRALPEPVISTAPI